MQSGKVLSRGQTNSFSQPFSAISATMNNRDDSSVVSVSSVRRVTSVKMASRTQSRLKGNENCKPRGGEPTCCLCYCSHSQSIRQALVVSILENSLIGIQQIDQIMCMSMCLP